MTQRENRPDRSAKARPAADANPGADEKTEGGDFFTDMAAGMAGAMERRPGMEPFPPPEIPDGEPRYADPPPEAPPPPHAKLDSAEKLRERVAALREHYAPFLRNRVPEDPVARPTRSLNRFHFRFEEAADRAEAGRAESGQGEWEEVAIPHYRGPVGRWAAYYRTTFEADDALLSRGRVWLHFRAVDYRCQVFVNGHYVGAHEGLFAPFAFDITDHVTRHGENRLLVRVENDAPQRGMNSWRPWRGYGDPAGSWPFHHIHGDKAYGGTGQGWDSPLDEDGTPGAGGWSHCPPGAGIWQPVLLEARPVTGIADLFVRPLPEESRAELWMETWHSEFGRAPATARLELFANNFDAPPVDLGRHELAQVEPNRSLYKLPVSLPEFRWWTPDAPHLYTLRVRLWSEANGGETCESRDVNFGMRSFTQDTSGPRKGTFRLNGEPIILRGTNEMGNLSVPIQNGDAERAIGDLLIGKAAHLNFWRITQRPVQSEVYDLCDRLGVLFQTDLPMFHTLRQSCFEETARQAGEMERLIRRHPAAILSSFINEPAPDGQTAAFRHRVADRPTLEAFFEVCLHQTHLYNPDRVVKCADGDYNPPARHGMLDKHAYVCWHEDHGTEVGKLHKGELFDVKEGWLCGVGEYGAEGLEPLDTMRRHYPAEWLPDDDDDPDWKPDRIPKCQAWGWHHQWFDEQTGIKNWIAASHRFQSWAVRFMHEGFRRRADIINSTTLHLLINSYPNNWLKALCDFERRPLPAFFAFVDANTPIAVNLRTDRHAVTGGENLEFDLWTLNDTAEVPEGWRIVHWIERGDQTFDLKSAVADVPALAAECQGRFAWQSPVVERPETVTAHASLLDGEGEVRHDHAVRVELWPRSDSGLLADRKIAVLGAPGGPTERLAEAFGARPTPWEESTAAPELVLLESAEAAAAHADGLRGYLRSGGAMYALPQEGGAEWPFGPEGVRVVPHKRHQFVSRKTGHPVVEGLDPFHFNLWYDAGEDRINHLLTGGFLEGDALSPITLTGTGLWYTERRMVPATGELREGAGRAVFDQVRAAERCAGEPRATAYLARVFRYLLDSPGTATRG